MSNVKEVDIVARLPWDWASKLPEQDGAFFAGLFLNPIIGLRIRQDDAGREPVPETGGSCMMVRVTIAGSEALAWPALDRMARALMGVEEHGGSVECACARDIEDSSSRDEWVTLGDG